MHYSGSELVDIAKQIEAAGEAFYSAAMARVADLRVREVLLYLRDEESRHAGTFERLLKGLDEPDGEWRVDESYLGYMRVLADRRVFPSPEAAVEAVARLDGEAALLEYALAFEKDTILFLHELRSAIRPESQALIDALVAEERNHVRAIDRMLGALRAPGT
ncbi:MAG: ferritin family protein [Deltaproteobacteria bacterium]|nr:ferritin family protein [Deltaproteobacteria bacterium]